MQNEIVDRKLIWQAELCKLRKNAKLASKPHALPFLAYFKSTKHCIDKIFTNLQKIHLYDDKRQIGKVKDDSDGQRPEQFGEKTFASF